MEKSIFKYKIDPKLVDFTGRISVSSMFDLILGAAGDDAHSRGFGVDTLLDRIIEKIPSPNGNKNEKL